MWIEKCYVRTQTEAADCKPRKKTTGETIPATPLILDLQLPEM